MDKLASQIIAGSIKRFMALPANNIWLRDQNRLIPNDTGLYVVVGLISATPVSGQMYLRDKTTPASVNEVVRFQQLEVIQIDVLSRSNEALTRNWEVYGALRSIFCQQQQEKYNFKIMRVPRSFTNTSSAEGGSQLNRYSITIACVVWYEKETVLSNDGGNYYDNFGTRVDDANTIGTDNPIAEFDISEEETAP